LSTSELIDASPEVLVTHTKDIGHILQALHSTSSRISSSIDIPTAIAIAQLALKHRENKNLRQRIIVFVGSPLVGNGADEKGIMVKLAKKLKKHNVAVDIVAFGDGIEEGETSVLKAFVDAASSGDNSYVQAFPFFDVEVDHGVFRHMISVPPGSHLLSDALLSSPILAGDRGIPEEAMGDAAAGTSGEAAGGDGYEFGVDPTLDPELAMVCDGVLISGICIHACHVGATGVDARRTSTTTGRGTSSSRGIWVRCP
jgi:26S proteasome regulatory subunit N10